MAPVSGRQLGTDVARSAAYVAIKRAIETEKPDALLHDPLALPLARAAGDDYVRACTARWRAEQEQEAAAQAAAAAAATANNSCGGHADAQRSARGGGGCGPGAGAGDAAARALPRVTELVVLRARHVDDVLARELARLRRQGAPRMQVVLLGAGLDARPWRLPLGPDVSWFEVDTADVSACKSARLDAIGAATAPPAGGGGCGGDTESAFPLRCGRWAACVADLADASWVARLQDGGWQPAIPTIFIAEGLVYYMAPADVDALLRTAAAAVAAAPGSALIVTGPNAASLDIWRENIVRMHDADTLAIINAMAFALPFSGLPRDAAGAGAGAANSTAADCVDTAAEGGAVGVSDGGCGARGDANAGADLAAWLSSHGWALEDTCTLKQMMRGHGAVIPFDEHYSSQPAREVELPGGGRQWQTLEYVVAVAHVAAV